MNIATQFGSLEETLVSLQIRIPNLPATELMICRMIVALGRDLSSRLEQQIRPHGLAEAEFRVLSNLFTQPDGVADSSDLARAAAQSAANMSRISDALVARTLVTRGDSARDRRRMVLQITAQGSALVQRLLPVMFLPLRSLLRNLSAAEQLQMIAHLRQLGASLDEVPK